MVGHTTRAEQTVTSGNLLLRGGLSFGRLEIEAGALVFVYRDPPLGLFDRDGVTGLYLGARYAVHRDHAVRVAIGRDQQLGQDNTDLVIEHQLKLRLSPSSAVETRATLGLRDGAPSASFYLAAVQVNAGASVRVIAQPTDRLALDAWAALFHRFHDNPLVWATSASTGMRVTYALRRWLDVQAGADVYLTGAVGFDVFRVGVVARRLP